MDWPIVHRSGFGALGQGSPFSPLMPPPSLWAAESNTGENWSHDLCNTCHKGIRYTALRRHLWIYCAKKHPSLDCELLLPLLQLLQQSFLVVLAPNPGCPIPWCQSQLAMCHHWLITLGPLTVQPLQCDLDMQEQHKEWRHGNVFNAKSKNGSHLKHWNASSITLDAFCKFLQKIKSICKKKK